MIVTITAPDAGRIGFVPAWVDGATVDVEERFATDWIKRGLAVSAAPVLPPQPVPEPVPVPVPVNKRRSL